MGHLDSDIVGSSRLLPLRDTQDIPQGTVRVLAAAGYTEVAHVDEVTDENASPEDAEDLSIPVGTRLLVHTRTAATEQRVIRVTRFTRLGGRVRLIWQTGNKQALDLIPVPLDSAGPK